MADNTTHPTESLQQTEKDPGLQNDKTATTTTLPTSPSDDALIHAQGYTPPHQRPFTLLSLLAVGFSISNSWFAVTGALVTGIANGGPVVYMYGAIFMALIHLCVGASLSELASAWPNSGGQYYWVLKLRRGGGFWAYLTGFASWCGAVITGASVALVLGHGVVGCVILMRPEVVYQRWMGFVAYQVANGLVFFLNCFERILPGLSKASLYVSLVSMVAIAVTVLAASERKQSADFVFTKYVNMSGWNNDVVALLTGLLGVNWGFSCLDACTHISEEVPRPSHNVPRAILGTVLIGFLTSFLYSIAILFSLTDLEAIILTPTMVPNLELFSQALSSKPGAIILEVLVLLTATGCLMTIHTWQSRLMWAFARDGGFLGSHHLAKLAPSPYAVPLWAHFVSCVMIAVLGCVYLGSSTGFGSLVTGCILMQYISYCIPVLLLMLRGRKIPHGPFWLGKWGWVANAVTVGWAMFALVFYSFPYVMPATKDNMNYVTVVLGAFLLYAIVYWFVRGQRTFVGVKRLREHEDDA